MSKTDKATKKRARRAARNAKHPTAHSGYATGNDGRGFSEPRPKAPPAPPAPSLGRLLGAFAFVLSGGRRGSAL